MQLPLLPGIQVQVSMPLSGTSQDLAHLHRQEHSQASLVSQHGRQQAQGDDSQKQPSKHAEEEQVTHRCRAAEAHTRLLKYSGQLCSVCLCLCM